MKIPLKNQGRETHMIKLVFENQSKNSKNTKNTAKIHKAQTNTTTKKTST